MLKPLFAITRILAANALLIVALLGVLLVAGGVALKFDPATALIVTGVILLADGYFTEARSKQRDR